MTHIDAAQSDHYRSLGLENDYTFVSGTHILPLAENPPTDPVELLDWVPFAAVKVHADYRIRNFRYSAAKERTPPIMPAPADQGAYTFVGGTLNLPHPMVQSDGSTRWAATASYYFAEGCASNSTTGFVIGISVDALSQQVDNVPYGTGVTNAPANVQDGGIGPKAGWVLGRLINLDYPSWDYREPSYYPAQLLSTEMLCGPVAYPDLSFTVSEP